MSQNNQSNNETPADGYTIAADPTDSDRVIVKIGSTGATWTIHRDDADPEHRFTAYRLAAGWFANLPQSFRSATPERVVDTNIESTEQQPTIRWVEVVFLQGDDAYYLLDVIMDKGTYAAIEYLSDIYDQGDETVNAAIMNQNLYPTPTHGEQDRTDTLGEYTLSYNHKIGYVGLSRAVEVEIIVNPDGGETIIPVKDVVKEAFPQPITTTGTFNYKLFPDGPDFDLPETGITR